MMMKTKFLLSFLALVGLVFAPPTTHAQTYQPSNRAPVADNTLGTQVSVTGNNFTITGGVSKGQTLFQSFSDFSVPTNGQANFLNPAGNRDIITRVTGNLFSDINGTVNTNGANFFLINPNGIVFGNNARLDVGKAFVGSTANSIDLVNGSGGRITFGTNLNGDALLKIAPNVLFDVSRLNLGGGNGAINNFGTLQTPNNNQYIGLIGGNVTLDGSLGGGKIIAPGGRVDIGGLSGAGTVTIDNNGFAFGGTGLQRSDVSLTNGAGITVRATGTLDTVNTFFNNASSNGSSINISTNNLDLLNAGVNSNTASAAIDAGLETNSGVQTKPGGSINIDATGKVSLNNSNIKNTLRSGAEGSIGDVNIQAGALDVINNSGISAATSGQGNGGNINLAVNSGLAVNNNSYLLTTTSGTGNAGNINVTVNGNLELTNNSSIFSDSTNAQGNAGDINIKTIGDIKISGGDLSSASPIIAAITSDTSGQGDAGKITLVTQGKLSLVNTGDISSNINATGVGNSKGISITARELELTNFSQISTTTAGKGNAGDINIKTIGDINISGYKSSLTKSTLPSQITSTTTGQGDAGKTTIDTQGKLSLIDTGFIASNVASTAVGNSKGISITAEEIELTNGSAIFTDTFSTVRGNAGDINIRSTGNIKISSNSLIDSSTDGRGDTGAIAIDTQGKLSIIDGRGISSSIFSAGVGRGRGITISAGEIELSNKSLILSGTAQTAAVAGTGKAGDLSLNVQGTIQVNSSSLIATGSTTTAGQTGNISITSDRLLLNQGDIQSSGGSVTGGDIRIFLGDNLLMRNNSAISSRSGEIGGNGNGGNITISSPLIIALPGNNNINANANGGNGGNVNITSQGLFGINYRAIGSNSTNDITASSTFGQNGAVKIDTPGTDPGKSSTELPQVPTDASNQISQVCSATNRQNKLTVAGRGGLPPNADDLLTPNIVWRDARATNSQPAISSVTTPASPASPAVGWVFDGKGRVNLVAAVTNGQPTGTSVVCPQTTK
jgi:filamentous hemagglutinin family protein